MIGVTGIVPEKSPCFSGKEDILGLDFKTFAIDSQIRIGKGAGLAASIYRQVFESGTMFPANREAGVSGEMPPYRLESWKRHFSVGLLAIDEVLEAESEAGITSKISLKTEDGYKIECVRIPMYNINKTNRATLCVSSQIGCGMGCSFCQTGTMGLVRDLRAAEIVSQVVTLRAAFGWTFSNIVFMGMGEPLDNFDNVSQAISVLHDQRGLNISWERITLCTSGSESGLIRLKSLGLKRLGLSISLNSARNEIRSSLMPANRIFGLKALATALASYSQRKNFVLGINYCLIPGVNDFPEDAEAVAGFCLETGRCIVNLIPYNPGMRPIARAPFEKEIITFIGRLETLGIPVKRRIEKGCSIMAGCGQLGSRNLR